MARKKPSTPGDPNPPGMTDAAGMLATYAAGVLAQPESRAHEVSLKLGHAERALLVGMPGLDVRLRERLDLLSTATRALPFTLDELARICLAVSEALLDVEGRDAVRMLGVAGKVTDLLNQAIGELVKTEKPRRAAPKIEKTTPRSKAAKATSTVYQLKVTLKDIKPPVWRRVQVPDGTLGDLHEVIQIVMGWTDSHLHQFVVRGTSYGPPAPDDFGFETDMEYEDEEGVLLSEVVKGDRKVKFRYEYDFGDGWQHDIEFERVVEREPRARYPRCVGGARACPPEDVGGPWGYADFLAAMADPKHEDHREMKEWIGGRFDPEVFSVDAVNKELRQSAR